MKINLICPIKNEGKILPFFLDYYLNFIMVDHIVLFDNSSTDNTNMIIKEWQLENPGKIEHVVTFHEKFDDKDLQPLFNESWKSYRNDYDWLITADCDEFIYHPNLRLLLDKYMDENITVPLVEGFDMHSMEFPEFTKGKYLPEIIKTGIKFDPLDKLAIFNPKLVEMNYGFGRHHWNNNSTGKVKYSETSEIKLLHYKRLSYDYFVERSAYLASLLSDRMIKDGNGIHNISNSKDTIENYKKSYDNSVKVI